MISMLIAPSSVAFGCFVICESWTAREKRHHPARASAWSAADFLLSALDARMAVKAFSSRNSTAKPQSPISAGPTRLLALLQYDNHMFVTEPRDLTLDVLLDLDGQVLVVDPAGGHWVRFVVTRGRCRRRSHTASTTRSRCTGRTVSGWSASTTRILSAGRSAAKRRTIVTACEASGRTSIGTRQSCSPISGRPWTRCCAREE